MSFSEIDVLLFDGRVKGVPTGINLGTEK